MVIRVWTEADTPRIPRARIISLARFDEAPPVTSTAAGEGPIVDAVREWLRVVVGAPVDDHANH